MIKPLRKRHLQIWILWAFLLPAGIITAWLVIPTQPNSELLQPAEEEALPLVINTAVKENYIINLRSNHEKTRWQLEWINKSVLTVPSAIIYRMTGETTDISKGELVGRIEARGTYRFLLKDSVTTSLHLVVYDFIHQQKIDSVKF